jgi:LacI family transcriptional regulator
VEAARVTLQDVARQAGVSRTTASFVMTGRRDMRISVDAEQRVLRAARELNYRPNLLARSLRTNLSQTLGLISDSVASEAFAGEMVRGSLATALQHDHLLFIGETEGDPEVEKHLVQSMLDRGVGGFVYATLYSRRARLSALLKSRRVVMLNCLGGGRTVPSVLPDEQGAGRAAADVLLDAGHRDGIFLVGETGTVALAGRERRDGVEHALAARGASLAGVVDSLWWPESAQLAVAKFLADGGRPSAFICMNDRAALGAYQALQEVGMRIPDDVSVVSFDDSDLASWVRPGLTSVKIPHFEMARRAVELLVAEEPARGEFRIEMPVRLRDSVGPPSV